MTCTDVERILPEVIDGVGDDLEFRAHLRSCPNCAELVADLRLIASQARELAEVEDPPSRVWVRISNQLRVEGLIRDPESAPLPRPIPAPAPSRRWSAWWLAPVAAAILAAGSYQLTHKATPTPSQATLQRPAQPVTPPVPQTPPNVPSATGQSIAKQTPTVRPMPRPSQPAVADSPMQAENSPLVGDEDQQFLTEVSQRAPGMRATYQNQLRAVNAEIRETQQYIKMHPGDLDARQYLMETYQQKAMLYQMALDHIQ